MKRTLFITLLLALACTPAAFAEDEAPVYKFPEIRPAYNLTLGYRFVGLSGSESAQEYEYFHNGLFVGGSIITFPFPHRFHLEVEYANKKMFSGDLSYSYRDTVMARFLNRSSYHNLENRRLVDLGSDAAFTVGSLNPATDRFGISSQVNTGFLRLKTPDYPLHFYLEGQVTDWDGIRQQRYLGGSGYFGTLARSSRTRTVEWASQELTFGLNSHLGPIELDVSHSEKEFSSKTERVYSEFFSASSSRGAGTYPHSLVPDSEGSRSTVKVHTSHTGKLVSSATLSWAKRKNNDSGASADVFAGAGDITWMPATKVTFFLRYKHRDTESSNPDSLPANYLGFGSYASAITGVRNSLSSTVDSLSGSLRYRAAKALVMNVKYFYDRQVKDHAEEWAMDEVMRRNMVSVSADAKPSKCLKLTAKYEHWEIDNPEWNSLPARSDRGSLSASLTPAKSASLFLSYSVTEDSRDDIRYAGMQTSTESQRRDAKRDRVLGTLALQLPYSLVLTTSYSYFRNRVEQGLVYNDFTGSDQMDKNARYMDTAQNYSANLNYKRKYTPARTIELNGGVSQTRGKANFTPGIADAVTPSSIGTLSEVDLRETEYTVSGAFDLKRGWKAGVNYKYTQLENLRKIPENPIDTDGIAQVMLVTFTRRWQ